MKIAVLGAGRMGQQVLQVVRDNEDCQLAGQWRRGDDLLTLMKAADVAIDFTLPEASSEVIAAVCNSETPLVSGVTGLSDSQLQDMQAAAAKTAILYDRNMSLGVAVMTDLVRRARRSLGKEFGCEIIEIHHRHKQDKPSGTALKLAEAISEESGGTHIEIESQREGDVIGEHQVKFQSATESLHINHEAQDRRVFAEGAIVAASWLVSQPPGYYAMQDMTRQLV